VKTAVVLVVIVLMMGVPILVVIAVGKWISRRIVAKDPDSEFVRPLNKTGIALNICFALVVLGGFSASQFAPDSPLGSFLRSPRGAVAGFVALLVGFSAAQVALHAFGHPSKRR
jgi:hypothetical protein